MKESRDHASVQIGTVPVGDGHPVALAAEIGTYFNQDLGLAKEYLARIVAAKVPLFKSEILHDPDVCLKDSGLNITFAYVAGKQVENYRALIERKTVPLAAYAKLFAACREAGLPWIASVYDFEGIDFLVKEGGAAIKIARHNIAHLPLIAYSARTGLPVIFDAGLVYLDELARAVRVAQKEGAPVIINHHPGPNPTPAPSQNLRVIQTWKQTFGVPVGLSCHYRGEEILYTAVGLGANLIEKGVVDDNTRVEQDVVSAVNLCDLEGLNQRLLNCSAALGARLPQIPEPRDLNIRKGLVARAPISVGEKLTLANVGFAWPPLGIESEYWEKIDGSSAARNIVPGEAIRWSDVRITD
jgi:sialic acid synthase SpsE